MVVSGCWVRRACARISANASPRRDSGPLGQHALGLLDHDPGVQRGLQLFGEDVVLQRPALLQQTDGGDVGHALAQGDVVRGQRYFRDARTGSSRR